MVTARLTIDFDAAEGAIARLLGLVERRGFRIDSLAMAGGARASIELDVSPRAADRRVDTLALQIGRLHGIHAIAIAPSAAPTNIARITS